MIPASIIMRMTTTGVATPSQYEFKPGPYSSHGLLLRQLPADDRGLFDRTHLHFYTWDGWVDLLKRAGFRIDTVVSSGAPIGLAIPRWNGSLAVRTLERLSFESARLWKNLLAYQFIVRAHCGKRSGA